jgi:hypothetical protein
VFSLIGIICFVLLLMLGVLLFGRHHTKGVRGRKIYTTLLLIIATLLSLGVLLAIWSVLHWRGIL